MKTDILTVPTVTLALKAKKALSKRGISANVIKLDSYAQKSGCSYGIEFPTYDLYSAISLLKELGISYQHLSKERKK